jgi:hypothetical protein
VIGVKPGVKEFHDFLTGAFAKEVRSRYEQYQILSEADVQAFAWLLIKNFFEEYDPEGLRFRVFNKPYCKDLRIHPDLAVFKRGKPWVMIELKERKILSERSARREWDRLIAARKCLRPKRGYLVYVARYGELKVLNGPKGAGARFFFEIPIVLEQFWTADRISSWERGFRHWSKLYEALGA